MASAIGVVSALIDNVPLVAATMGMYDLSTFPQDSEFWQLVAYCAGTGGSMLVIGSAAGVAYMGMEKVDFFWYLRKVTSCFPLITCLYHRCKCLCSFNKSNHFHSVTIQVSGFAFAGYAAGIAAYLAVNNLQSPLPSALAHIPLFSSQ